MRRLLLLLAALSFAPAAAAQDGGAPEEVRPLDARQEVRPDRVKLGEPFTRTLVLTHDPAHRYDLVEPDGAPGDVEWLDHQRRREDSGGRATTTFTLRLSAFALGQVTLAPLAFDVATPEGPRRYRSPPSAVEVVPVLPDDAAAEGAPLEDIRPPEPVPVPSYTLLWVLLGVAGSAVAAFLLWRWWRGRDRAPAQPVAPLPPEVRARQALQALEAERLVEQGRVKEFYVRLSEIVRTYVGERFHVEALECTTHELMATLAERPAPGLDRAVLAGLLEEADLVKFARATPGPSPAARALELSFALVTRTTPMPAPGHAPAGDPP